MSKSGKQKAHRIHHALGRLELQENRVHSTVHDYSRNNMKQEMMDMIDEFQNKVEDEVPFYFMNDKEVNYEKR